MLDQAVNDKLTAIANKVRELSPDGVTATLSLDDMGNSLAMTATEVDEQSELIANIFASLEGKIGVNGSQTTVRLANELQNTINGGQ